MNYEFDVYDYIVLLAVLLISVLIGLHHALKPKYKKCFGRFNKYKNEYSTAATTSVDQDDQCLNEYFLASQSMSALPIALSIFASFFSATAILGFSGEVYEYGIQFWISVVTFLIAPLIGAYLTGPMFARLKVLSVFEYLKLRYDSNFIRSIGVICYFLRNLITTGIFIFAPVAALAAFTKLNLILLILLIGLTATFYTAIGGIKAVIYTDVFQSIIMYTGVFAIVIKGVYDVGGLSNLWEINRVGGRLNFFDFDPNPFIRQSFWSLTFGGLFITLIPYTIEQQTIQRFSSAKSIRTGQLAVLLNIPAAFTLVSLCCFMGLVLYANYETCNPLSAHSFDKNARPISQNQLLVFFVADKLKLINGMTGLFVAALLSGSMSSISSVLNSLAAILWQDLFKHISFFKSFNDKKSSSVVKILVVVCGVTCTCSAIVISNLSGNLIQISSALNGSFSAPLLGLFILSCLFPFVNVYGAAVGTLSGFLMGAWLAIGNALVKPVYPKLVVGTKCYNAAINSILTNSTLTAYSKEAANLSGYYRFHSISYMWFTAIATLVAITVGVVVSLLTCGHKQHIDDSLLLFPCLNKCFKKYDRVRVKRGDVDVRKEFETCRL